jgi:hypothetical protein
VNDDDIQHERIEPEPDFLDVMDSWDEIDPYEDEEKFVPMFQKEWVKIVAIVVAVGMFLLAAYSGLHAIFHWP